MRSLQLLVFGLLATATVAPVAGHAETPCVDATDAVYEIAENPLGITGKFALPAEQPTDLVAFAHGYSHDTDSWVEHIRRTAAQGAIAFAVDYRGTYEDDDGNVRGWFVQEGAEDTIEVARFALAGCPSLTDVFLYGVSMGGNTSGLAVAAGATRQDGSPLFDYWIAGEPVANVIETYLEATAVAPAVPFAARAKADIEREHGGTLWERPASYADGSIVLRVPDIAASGIRGVAIVHAFDDGTVPYNQGRELSVLLRAAQVPTDVYNVGRRENDGTADGSDNSTLTENVARPLLEGAGQTYDEPLAGHGTESSQTNIVIQTGLDVLFAMMDGGALPANHEFLVDGELGIVPVV